MARRTKHPAAGHFIGSADAPAILGLSKFKSARDAWDRIMGMEVRGEPSAVVRAGEDLEPYVLRRFAEATGHSLDRRRRKVVMERNPNLGAHLDAWDATENAVVEAKTSPFAVDYGEVADGLYGLPLYVRVQLMHQLMVTGATHGYVPVLLRGFDFRVYGPIPRDDLWIRDLRDELLDWWDTYVVPMIPPTDEPIERFPKDDGSTLVAGDLLLPTVSELYAARVAKAEAEAREKAARRVIEDAMGTATYLIAPGTKVRWKAQESVKVEWESVASSYRGALAHIVELAETGEAWPPELEAVVRDPATIESLYTRRVPSRPFVPTFDDEEARRLLPPAKAPAGEETPNGRED